MVSCAVKACKNYVGKKSLKNKHISFHRFPMDNTFKEKWIDAVNREEWFPTKTDVICSKHFKEECFNVTSGGRRYLFPDAVPTLFLREDDVMTVLPYIDASPSIEDTPKNKVLKTNLIRARKLNVLYKRKIRRLQSKVKVLKKRLANMGKMLTESKRGHLIYFEQKNVLENISVKQETKQDIIQDIKQDIIQDIKQDTIPDIKQEIKQEIVEIEFTADV